MMTKTDGSKCKTAEENADVFRDYFQQLYDRHPVFDPTVIELLAQAPIVAECDRRPNDGEIKKAVLQLKNNAPGESGLSPQMFKALIENEQSNLLLRDINLEFWDTELPPEHRAFESST